MKKLLPFLKGHIKESVSAPLFKMFEAILELTVPLVVASVIDIGITGRDKTYIITRGLLLIAIGLVGLGFSITAQYFAAKASVNFTKKIRHSLLEHIQALSFSQIDHLGVSTAITRMTSDVNQIQSGFNLTLRLLLRSPFIAIGAMIMAFTIDIRSALIFAVIIPILAAAIYAVILVSIPAYKKVQENLDRLLDTVRENLSGIRIIRAFSIEKAEMRKFKEENSALTKSQEFAGRISALLNPVTYIIINMAIIILIYTGALRIDSGILTQGALVALYSYMAQILVELIKLVNLFININKALASANRIQSILDTGSDQENKALRSIDKANLDINFEGVCLRYKGAAEDSLTDISFTAVKGETIGIIGGTGSGKTSLVNLIPRFYDAYKGKILIGGIDITDYDINRLREMIGIVPQKAVLFKGTVRENLQWGKEDATDAEIAEALKTAQGSNIINNLKNGLDSVIEQGGANLSGGQKQRLTIARAVIKDPPILILDDSTSALDFTTDAELRRAIRTLKNSPTVFIVSQRILTVKNADKIIVLDDGKAAGIGTHEELLDKCEVYREIYESQYKKEDKVL